MKQIQRWTAAATMTLCGALAAQTSQIVKDDLFNGTEIFAKGASDVTEVTMDPDTLGMVGGQNKEKARRTVLSVVRTYSYDKPGMYRIEDVDTFRNKLNTGDWHCSVHTRSLKSGESTDVCNKRRTDDLTETAIITVEPKELTFIHRIRRGGGGDMYSPFSGLSPLHGLGAEEMVNMKIAMAEMPAIMAEARAGMTDSFPVMIDGQIQLGLAKSFSKAQRNGVDPKITSRDMKKLQDNLDDLETPEKKPVSPPTK